MDLNWQMTCTAPWISPQSLAFGPTERIGVRGPSGVGKSTLLRAIAGIEPEAIARVSCGERVISDLPPHVRRFGYVPQDALLFSTYSVLENVAFGLRARGVGRAERKAQALEWLARVGLADKARAAPDSLSGGEAKRVALVRALAISPVLLLLDEPFSGLDEQSAQAARRLLLETATERGTPVLLVSHDPEDFSAICSRVVDLRPKSIEDGK